MNVEVEAGEVAESDGIARRVAVHAALADPSRLRIVDQLAISDLSPSELAHSLGIGSNLLAHHVRVLEGAGLIEGTASAGDHRRRYLRLAPEALAEIAEPVAELVARHILFVCTANSARSQLAAALWNARSTIPASSAGTRPAAAVRPAAVAAGTRAGLDLSGATTRSLNEVTERPDVVVTVCDVAHEALGSIPETAHLLHWSVPDPVRENTPTAFDRAIRDLASRIDRLAPCVHPLRVARRQNA